MGKLLSQVIPLALGAAISPVLFLLTLTTLTGVRPLVRGVALTAGAAIPLVLLGAFAFAISGSLHTSSATKAGVDLALGVPWSRSRRARRAGSWAPSAGS